MMIKMMLIGLIYLFCVCGIVSAIGDVIAMLAPTLIVEVLKAIIIVITEELIRYSLKELHAR